MLQVVAGFAITLGDINVIVCYGSLPFVFNLGVSLLVILGVKCPIQRLCTKGRVPGLQLFCTIKSFELIF
jgi:hypothetical protein